MNEARKLDQTRAPDNCAGHTEGREKKSILSRLGRLLIAPDLNLETYRRLEGISQEERKDPKTHLLPWGM